MYGGSDDQLKTIVQVIFCKQCYIVKLILEYFLNIKKCLELLGIQIPVGNLMIMNRKLKDFFSGKLITRIITDREFYFTPIKPFNHLTVTNDEE